VLAGFGAVTVERTAHDCLWAHRRGEGGVLALGLANGETGLLSEVPEWDGPVLLDVVQAVGRVPFAFGWSGVDFAILSAHKLGGPKGVGALIIREGVDIASLRPGGGQEQGRPLGDRECRRHRRFRRCGRGGGGRSGQWYLDPGGGIA